MPRLFDVIVLVSQESNSWLRDRPTIVGVDDLRPHVDVLDVTHHPLACIAAE